MCQGVSCPSRYLGHRQDKVQLRMIFLLFLSTFSKTIRSNYKIKLPKSKALTAKSTEMCHGVSCPSRCLGAAARPGLAADAVESCCC